MVGASALGVCAYLRTVPAFGCIEIGHVAFAPALRRTTAATEAIWCVALHIMLFAALRHGCSGCS